MSRYQLSKKLGQGGQATVYEGSRRLADGTEQRVAFKCLRTDLQHMPDFVDRFHNEATRCLELAHPNVVRVYDFDATDKGPLMIMELVEGPTVGDVREALRPRYDLLRHVFGDVLQGLDYLHRHGVIHRDVSPANIILSRGGAVKLLDLGSARYDDLPKTCTAFGTAPYMSPEQLRGLDLDPSTDLYALAAVAYEVLTGSPPFGNGDRYSITTRQYANGAWRIPPLPDEIPDDLREVITGLLQPVDTRAFRSAQEVIDATRQYQQPMAGITELSLFALKGLAKRGRPSDTGKQDKPPSLARGNLPLPPRRTWFSWRLPAALLLLLGSIGGGMFLKDRYFETRPRVISPHEGKRSDSTVTMEKHVSTEEPRTVTSELVAESDEGPQEPAFSNRAEVATEPRRKSRRASTEPERYTSVPIH